MKSALKIKAFSFTCLRDIELVKRLHEQLEANGVEHTMYVDEIEVGEFSKILPCKSRGRHPNSTNGFGEAGFYAKLECIKDMVQSTKTGYTILDCDSDVVFENKKIILDMICQPNEFKGWCEGCNNSEYENQFNYNSGACKSYSYELGKIISELTRVDLIKKVRYLMDIGQTPSKDAMTFYLLKELGKQTNLYNKYQWVGIQNKNESKLIIKKR